MKIGIAGAGIMGRLLSFTLAQAGHEISLFDQTDASSEKTCSMTAAGLLAPLTELDKADVLIYALGRDALQTHWPVLLSQLNSAVFFQKKGTLVVAHRHDYAELQHFIRQVQQKIPVASRHYQLLSQAEIAQLEPEMTKFQDGYYFPDEAHVHSQQLLMALEKNLREKKINWHMNTCVEYVAPHVIKTKQPPEMFSFDYVIDCRGTGAKKLFQHLQGVRGELIYLHAPDVHITRPIRLMHPRHHIYLLPRADDVYVVGASEIYSEDMQAISVRTTLELLTAAHYVHPGFAEATMIKTMTHCRPTLPHHLPVIKYIDGLLAVNGLYRHGFLIAPTLAAEVSHYLTQGIATVCYPQLWEQYQWEQGQYEQYDNTNYA